MNTSGPRRGWRAIRPEWGHRLHDGPLFRELYADSTCVQQIIEGGSIMSNIETVQGIYASFGRGDIPAILAHLAENIEWDYGVSDAGVPWLQPRKGRAAVPKFFESLGALDFQHFHPKTLLEGDNIVVALIDVAFVVKATGRKVTEENEVHIWHFDGSGHVTRFCHKVDTHQHWVAIQG